MPHKRPSVVPLLLPGIFVALGALVVLFLVSTWHAADAQAAGSERLRDSTLFINAELDGVLRRQKQATELLSRSPLVWLWVKFQEARLTPSNRLHSDNAWKEIANYGRLLPGAILQLGNVVTHTLYQDGAPVRNLVRDDPESAWYYSVLGTEGVVVSGDEHALRTAARILDGARVIGAVSCVSDGASLAAAILAGGVTDPEMVVALADGAGELARAAGPGSAGARTLFDMYPAAARAGLRAALDDLVKTGETVSFRTTEGAQERMTAALRTPVPGLYLFASLELPGRLATDRLVFLAAVSLAALALLILGLVFIGAWRIGSLSAPLAAAEADRDSARVALDKVSTAADGARSAEACARTLADGIAAEAEAAARSSAEAAAVLAKAEEAQAEFLAGIGGRMALMDRLAAATRQVLERSDVSRLAAEGMDPQASRAEEELTRVITNSAAASGTLDRARKGANALLEQAQRMRMLSMNAALETARAGSPAQGMARIAEEVRGLSDDVTDRSRLLLAALEETTRDVQGAVAAAQDAGGAVHAASSSARAVVQAMGGAEEAVRGLLLQVEKAGQSAARVGRNATLSDRGRSALAGVERIAQRMRSLVNEFIDALPGGW